MYYYLIYNIRAIEFPIANAIHDDLRSYIIHVFFPMLSVEAILNTINRVKSICGLFEN
jgi:hypothetical protein